MIRRRLKKIIILKEKFFSEFPETNLNDIKNANYPIEILYDSNIFIEEVTVAI